MSYEKYVQIRTSKGLKDAEVARIAQIPASTFSDWKKGKSAPKTEKLQKIAEALGVSYAELIGMDIEKAPVPKFEPELIKVTSLFSQLTAEEKQLILDTMTRFVASHK